MAESPRRRILLVDDEDNFRWSVKQLLEMRGYEVVAAESAESALTHLGRGSFDLVITDIRMPGMDGFELVKWLREHRSQVRVVMTTGYDSFHARERSTELGALSYLEKPVDQKELTDLLQRLFMEEGFAGRVKDLKLFDYLQLLSTARKDKILEVKSHAGVGRVHLRDGFIVHAEHGERVGQPALFEIMRWRAGDITDLPPDPAQPRTLHESTSWLLLEAARRIDEDGVQAPPPAPPAPPTVPQDPFERVLAGRAEVEGLQGAMLLSAAGRVLARSGDLPEAIKAVVWPLCEGCAAMGEDLGLGRYDEAILHLRGGERILVEPLADLYLCVRVSRAAEMADIRAWFRTVARLLSGRPR